MKTQYFKDEIESEEIVRPDFEKEMGRLLSFHIIFLLVCINGAGFKSTSISTNLSLHFCQRAFRII